MPAPPTLALLLLLPLVSSAPGPQSGAQRLPLEELLQRARERRDEQRARLEPQVLAAVEAFPSGGEPVGKGRAAQLTETLVALGPAAGPLLVRYLDPAPAEEPAARKLARAVADALALLPNPATTDPLLAALATASTEGRRNVMRALEGSPEPARVRPALVSAFESAPQPDLQQAALRALIRLGSAENADLYSRVLSSDDPELVALALGALVDTGDTQAAPQVRALLAATGRATRHSTRLLAFYRAQPELVDEAVLLSWVALAREAAATDTRVEVLEALPDLAGANTGQLRRALEPMAKTVDGKVREAALVALVRLGDRNARRRLLESYDEFVDKNDRFPDAYVRRGKVYLRIEDWDDAIRDFQQALKVARDNPRPLPEAYVGMARAYARRGRMRDAAEWLRRAPISIKELRALADDPDFRELRESRYSEDAFGF